MQNKLTDKWGTEVIKIYNGMNGGVLWFVIENATINDNMWLTMKVLICGYGGLGMNKYWQYLRNYGKMVMKWFNFIR